MKWLSISSPKNIRVKVSTYESDLELNIPAKSTGKYLFDLVCSSIGLRETWFFGLQSYTQDDKGTIKLLNWLNLEKKIVAQRNSHHDKTPLFFFHAKFFPEDVEQELIQSNTRHLFYLQVRDLIFKSGSPELLTSRFDSSEVEKSVIFHLTALAAKADMDCISEEDLNEKIDDETILSNKLLRMIPFHTLSNDEKLDLNHILGKVKEIYQQHSRLNKNEAQLQFLKLAQAYRLFGVNFFSINCMRIRGLRTRSLSRYLNRAEVDSLQASNKQYGSAFLGVSASGIQLYEQNNKFKPMYSFSWSIIKNVLYREPKVCPDRFLLIMPFWQQFTVKLNSNWRMTFHQSQIPASPSHQGISTEVLDPSLMMEFNASGSNLSIRSSKQKQPKRSSLTSTSGAQPQNFNLLTPQSTPSSPAVKKSSHIATLSPNLNPRSSSSMQIADNAARSKPQRHSRPTALKSTLTPQ
ncbi:hypothetical protein Ciccas_006410, partial [Cichlidogyrus casuarinus]